MASVLIAQHHTTLLAFVTVVDYMFLVFYCDDCLLVVLSSTSLLSVLYEQPLECFPSFTFAP